MVTSAKRPRKARPKVIWMYRLHIELLDVEPTVWRCVQVPETISLAKLHAVIQVAMGWTNSHLHEFVINGLRYSDTDPDLDFEPGETVDERGVALDTALGRAVRTFDYIYDFGDDWHHGIVLEAREPVPANAAATVLCLGGEHACPPEDVGGAFGYAEFLEAIGDPEHPDHEDLIEWSGGAHDPLRFDVAAVNTQLKRITL